MGLRLRLRLRLVHWATLIGLRSFLQPRSPGGAGSYRFGCGEGRRAEPAPTVRGSRPCRTGLSLRAF